MMLYINGSDIAHLTLGFKEYEGTWQFASFNTSPERFLQAIDKFLKKNACNIDDVNSIFVVVGTGSATALRASVTIANTWRFVRQIALYGIQKDPEQSDEEALNTYIKETKNSVEYKLYLEPKYMQEPRITLSNKDQLGRSLEIYS